LGCSSTAVQNTQGTYKTSETAKIGNIPEEAIFVKFSGTDSSTKKVYFLDAIFINSRDMLKFFFEGAHYELTRERAASGILYKNDEFTFRGKGKEAVLTDSKGRVILFHEIE